MPCRVQGTDCLPELERIMSIRLTSSLLAALLAAGAASLPLPALSAPSADGSVKVSDSTAAAEVPSFDSVQVAHGKALYTDACAKCHGEKLEGNVAPALRGPAFAPASKSHITVGGIYQYMANNMPADRPGQMKDEEYADLLAYLLHENGYDAGKTHLIAGVASASTVPLNAGPRQGE